MKTVFARVLVAAAALAALTATPASAFASAKTTHSHGVAKKEPKKKGVGKHHIGHKTASSKPTHTPTPAKES